MSLAIEAFVDNVHRYCEWVESQNHDALKARQLLLSLMTSIPYLVASESEQQGNQEYPWRSHDEWKATHKCFADFPFQYYRLIFAPLTLDDEVPVIGDIHDDLADIYGELWHGLQALNHNDGVYAVRYWRETYVQHWGHHASAALYALDEHYRLP
jgi:hypothetical protein